MLRPNCYIVLLVYWLYLLFPCNIFAQEELPVFKKVSYPFLPVTSSNTLFFSKDGLMWFSNTQGLVSFDGSGIVYHNSLEQNTDMGLSQIYCIGEDEHHNFYISTIKGLYFFNRRKKAFEEIKYTYRGSQQKKSLDIRAMYIDANGLLYCGSSNTGYFIYSPATKKITHFNLDPSKPDYWYNRIENTVTCFLAYPGDTTKLWMGTFNGIYKMEKDSHHLSRNFTVINPMYNFDGVARQSYDVEEMIMPNDSTIYFNIYAGGFAVYNTHTGKMFIEVGTPAYAKKNNIPFFSITSFVQLSDSTYLLGASNPGPAIFNVREHSIRFFKLNVSEYGFDWIQWVTKDPKGNVFIKSNGIWYESIPAFGRMQYTGFNLPSNSGPIEEWKGIYFDTSTHCYFGAVRMSNSIHVMDSNFKPLINIPAPLFTNFYTNNRTCTDRITKDGSGRFWTTGWETYILTPGAKQFDHAEKLYSQLKWLKSKGEFYDIITIKNGNILMLESKTGSLYCVDHSSFQTDTIKLPEMKDPFNNNIGLSYISYDSLRNLVYLAGTYGIAQYDFVKKSMRVIASKELFGNELPGEVIPGFAADANGRLWVLKRNYGVRLIDPISLLCIDSILMGTKGFINGTYSGINFGGPDCMFFESNAGIVIYNYQAKRSIYFDNTNGLSHPTQPAVLYANHNLVVGMQGIVQRYDTRNFLLNNFHPQPMLNTLSVDTGVIYTREAADNRLIQLPHQQNSFTLSFSAPEFIFPERIEYAYRMVGVNNEWQYSNYLDRKVNYNNLPPGKYLFQLKAQMKGDNWNDNSADYTIDIIPAWWQTNLFKTLRVLASLLLVILVTRWRIRYVRAQEKVKALHEKELMEYEARALRAQMNPHFIFNCLNSIKALTQNNETQRATEYLTTFSKLIRTLFHNSDRRQISLYDEIETCRLYVQLEAMRLDGKLNYQFDIDPNVDLKSVMVPALIIQPFIENAIWHGIVPRGTGNVIIMIKGSEEAVTCSINDDGIGRELSQLNKPVTPVIHESKGVHLSQARLQLGKLLNEMNATIETTDMYEMGKATGTHVLITFKLN